MNTTIPSLSEKNPAPTVDLETTLDDTQTATAGASAAATTSLVMMARALPAGWSSPPHWTPTEKDK